MESLKIERTKISLEIYGEKINVRRPNVEEVEAMEEKLGNKKDKDSNLKKIRELMASLGLPQKVIKGLETEHLFKVLEFLIGAKKN